MNVEKLRRLQAQVRIGGKGTPRRKKKVTHQSAATDDKKLQSSLKKLSVSTIPGIEEVNIIKDDLTVIHFNNPKAQASLSANTFAVTGHGESKKIVEMLPEILPQLGQETVMQLRMFANTMSQGANKNVGSLNGENSNILSKVAEEDDDEVPLLVNDFEQVAKLEEASKAVKTTKIVTFDADVPYDKELSNDGIQSKNLEQKVENALNSTELLTHKSQEAMTQSSKDENKGKKSNNKQQQQQQQLYAHDGEAKNKTETAKVIEDKKIRQIKIEKPGKQEIKTSTPIAGAAAKNTKKEHDNQKILASAKVKDSAAAKDVKTNETLKQTSNKKDRDVTDVLNKPEPKHIVKEDSEIKPSKVKANESKPVKDKSEGKNEKLQESNKSKKSEKVEKKTTEENKKAKKGETDNNDKALNKKPELAKAKDSDTCKIENESKKCSDHEQKEVSVKIDAVDATELKTATEQPKEDKVSQEHSLETNAKPSTAGKEIKKSESQNDKKVSNEASDKNKENKLENTTKGKAKAARDNTKIKEDKLTMATQQKEAPSEQTAQHENSSQALPSPSKKGENNLKLDINKAKQSVTASNKSPTNRATPQPKPQTTRKSPAKNLESPILAPKLSPPTKGPTPQPKPQGKKPTTPPDAIHDDNTKNKDINQKPDRDLEIKKSGSITPGSVSETSAEDKALKGTLPLSTDSTPAPKTKGASPIKTNQNVKSQSTVKQTQVTDGAAPKSSPKQKQSKSVTPTKPSGEVGQKPVQQLAASPKENVEITVKRIQQPTEPTKKSVESITKNVHQTATPPKENLEVTSKPLQQPTIPAKENVEGTPKLAQQPTSPKKANAEATPKLIQEPTKANAPAIPKEVPQPAAMKKAITEDTPKPVQQLLTSTKPNVDDTPKQVQQPTNANAAAGQEVQQSAPTKRVSEEETLKQVQQPTTPTKMVEEDVPKQMEQPTMPAAKTNVVAIPKEVPQSATTTKAIAEDTIKPVQQPVTSTKSNVDDTPKQVQQPTNANVAAAKELQQPAATKTVSEEDTLKQVQQPTTPTKMVEEDILKQMEQSTMPAQKTNVVAIPKELQQPAITTKVSEEDTLKQVLQPPTPTKIVAEDTPKQMKNVTKPTKINVEAIPKEVPQSPQTPTKVNTKSATPPSSADVAPKSSQQSTTSKKPNEKSKSKQQQKKVSPSEKECKTDGEGKTTSPVKTSDMQIKSSLKTDENELKIQPQTKSTSPKPTTSLVGESPNSQIPAVVSANVEEKNKRTTVSTVSIISVKTESLPSTLPVSEAPNFGQMSQQITEQSTLVKDKQIQSVTQLPTLTKALGDGGVAGRLQDDKNPSQALVLGKPIIPTVATGSSQDGQIQKQDSLAKLVTIPQGSNESRAKLQQTSPFRLNPSPEQMVLDSNKSTSQVNPDDGKNIMQDHANKEPLLEISGKIEDISKAKSVCPTQSIIAMKDNNQVLFSNAPSTPTEALALNLMEEAKKPIIQTKDFAEANLQLLYSQLMMQQSPTDNKLPTIDQPMSKTDMKIKLPEGQSVHQTLNQQQQQQQLAQTPAEPFQQVTTASTVPTPTNQPPSTDTK